MPEIMTVRGPIASADLGFTSMHEHVLYDGRIFRRRFESFIPPDAPVKPEEAVRLDNLGQLKHGFIMSLDAIVMRDEDIMAAELADFRSEGGSAVVDMSTPGLRVDPRSPGAFPAIHGDDVGIVLRLRRGDRSDDQGGAQRQGHTAGARDRPGNSRHAHARDLGACR